METTFNKFPSTKLNGFLIEGWERIISQIKGKIYKTIAFDCYPGVRHSKIKKALLSVGIRLVDAKSLMKSEEELITMTSRFMTDDILFGYITNLRIEDYFDPKRVKSFREEVRQTTEPVLLYGYGAHYVLPESKLLIFADMARTWDVIKHGLNQQKLFLHI